MPHYLTTFSKGFDPGEIIACDPVGLVTLAIPIAAGQGWLARGTLIEWNRAPGTAGRRATAIGDTTFGVLAFGLNTDQEEDTGGTVYLKGAFILPRVRAANTEINIDGPAMEVLRHKGLILENAGF